MHSTAPPLPVRNQQGQYFVFALPAGWGVQENSNLICLSSPDQAAAIMCVGLVGMLQPFTPDQFVGYALHMHSMYDLHFLSGQPIPPAAGCAQSALFELTYATNGIPCRGIARSDVAHGYGQCNASMTLAASRTEVWHAYSGWLPQVAAQVAPAGPQTFMAGMVAAQNLQNSIELGRRAREVNDYIQNLQQQTTDQRWESQDRQNFHFRENLGGVATYTNPFEGRAVELPNTHQYYWVNRQGQVVGTDDPGYDPRVGSPLDWAMMRRFP